MTGEETLDAYSYVTISIFIAVIFFVIRPVTVKVKKIKLYLNLSTVPLLGVLLLLLCRAIDWGVVKRGFLGTLGVQPWGLLILIYSLAYICISLDMTGVFQFFAFWVSKKAGDRGLLAFTLFFILTTLMSGLTSNDVVILTGTVFLSYFTKVSGITPTAFLVSEFTTANIASMALFIGNPTNVIVSEAYGISFLSYSAWMLLPTVVTLILSYVVLRVLFRSERYIPKQIHSPDTDPKSVLIDPRGAIFGFILLGLCLVTLVATSFAHVPVWVVTLPYAVVMLLYDMQHDLGLSLCRRFRSRNSTHASESISLDNIQPSQPLPEPSVMLETTPKKKKTSPFRHLMSWFNTRLPTVRAITGRLPWSILPFSLGMFILIQALSEKGWVGIFATAMAVFTKNYVTAVLGMTTVSILACQFLNNLPMTILFTQIIQHPNFATHVHSEATQQGFLLGLIVGSNLGACLTLVGSLAGIMFDHILKTKGIYTLGYFQFLKWNLFILPVLILGASAIVIAEIWFFYLH
ncbi:arsenical pump membrane protein-domain-containing protein [Sporodiniella umbellata]|nr:arsenical pump membrane protein-domain-containing protein [Sporodiniella umbellata]